MRNIPPAILVGLIVNALLGLLGIEHSVLPQELGVLRDVLLVVFFICVGLSLSFGDVRSVFMPVRWVVGAAVVLIIGQNIGGILIARLFGEQLETGVLLGSVSFVGGFGSAVAWGAVLEERGMVRATSIGVAGAMLGTVLGAAIAGPFGEFLRRGRPSQGDACNERGGTPEVATVASSTTEGTRTGFPTCLSAWVLGLSAIAVAYLGGEVLQTLLASVRITLPRFLTGMLVAVVLIGIFPGRMKRLWRSVVLSLESKVLNVFLVITFAMLDYRTLWGMGAQVVTTALFQVALTVAVAWGLVFEPIRRRTKDAAAGSYPRAEAAAIAAAVVGFGLSSLSVAMAVIARMSAQSHPLPRARQTIAVTGAGIVDLLNALAIGVTLWWIA